MLRNRSPAVMDGGGDVALWRLLDHGRLCDKLVATAVEEQGIWAGLGRRTLTWAVADYDFDGVTFSGLRVWDIDLSGRCQASPTLRMTPQSLLPSTPIDANGPVGRNGIPEAGVAIDGRTLCYATGTAIHRLRLPAHGAIAMPPGG
jgi:hypothetical protein